MACIATKEHTRMLPMIARCTHADAKVKAWPRRLHRRPKHTPIHELERYMRCRQCSERRGYPFKRTHLIALRKTKITASDQPSHWWPGER